MPDTLTTKLADAWWQLERFLSYLNSKEFYQLSLAIGVHTGAVVFTAFAVIMLTLLYIRASLRSKAHFLWTWIVCSLAFFLIRAVTIYRIGDDGRIFIFALAWWNLTISGIAALVSYTVQAFRQLSGKKEELP